VKIFEKAMTGKELHFELSACILCVNKGTLTARLKPAIAGSRILSIDDGDIRDVVSLEFLRLLQEVLEDNMPLQDLFDQAFETSSDKKMFQEEVFLLKLEDELIVI
jgi:hypothetical protein